MVSSLKPLVLTTGRTPLSVVNAARWFGHVYSIVDLVQPSWPRNAERPELAGNELGAFVIG